MDAFFKGSILFPKLQKPKIMKFHWGTGIAIFYTIFAGSLIFQVIKSTQYDNSLVSDEYYKDDLAYQEHYNKLVNAKALSQDLKIHNKPQQELVELVFPAELSQIQGEIVFFCPSNSRLDFKVPIDLEKGKVQKVETNGLKKGLWRVKVDYQSSGKAYFKEEVINI